MHGPAEPITTTTWPVYLHPPGQDRMHGPAEPSHHHHPARPVYLHPPGQDRMHGPAEAGPPALSCG